MYKMLHFGVSVWAVARVHISALRRKLGSWMLFRMEFGL